VEGTYGTAQTPEQLAASLLEKHAWLVQVRVGRRHHLTADDVRQAAYEPLLQALRRLPLSQLNDADELRRQTELAIRTAIRQAQEHLGTTSTFAQRLAASMVPLRHLPEDEALSTWRQCHPTWAASDEALRRAYRDEGSALPVQFDADLHSGSSDGGYEEVEAREALRSVLPRLTPEQRFVLEARWQLAALYDNVTQVLLINEMRARHGWSERRTRAVDAALRSTLTQALLL